MGMQPPPAADPAPEAPVAVENVRDTLVPLPLIAAPAEPEVVTLAPADPMVTVVDEAINAELMTETATDPTDEEIYLSPAPRQNDGGVTDTYVSMNDDDTDHTFFPNPLQFGALPEGPYMAIVGTWSDADAEMIQQAFSDRNVEVYLRNRDHHSPSRIKNAPSKIEYLRALIEHEHNGMFGATCVILDLRGPLHHENDYLIGALAAAGQQMFVVVDGSYDNADTRAKLAFFQDQTQAITICSSIFDAVLLVADVMDDANFDKALPVDKTAEVTRTWQSTENTDTTPKNYRTGVSVLVRNERGQYLGFRREGVDGVYLPFGFMHNNETPAESATRVLKDELGIIVTSEDLVQAHVGWRGRTSGYIGVFGIRSTAVVRKTAPAAAYVSDRVWAEPDVFMSNSAYGAFNADAIAKYDNCGEVLVTVMDVTEDNLLNVSPTVAMMAAEKAEKTAAAPVAQA